MTRPVRLARREDLEGLRHVERAAGRLFAEIGLPEIAQDEPRPAEALQTYQRAGRAWVAVDDSDLPIAYALVDVIDGCAHVEQLSVHPDWQRQRIGSQLLDRVAAWAQAEDLPALTLVTFRDVPWNAPYYERCGFRVLAEHELTPGLENLRRAEARHGFDPATRVCMRRDLRAPA